MNAPAEITRNLPALVTALPGDTTRAPQTAFTRARQVDFLENLSVTGSVRSAASAARVSHQTAYRARRGCAAFRTAWDAALVVARAAAADTLACRAIEGVEEKVFYHGEEVATRIRYDLRLLLAHLARLDRLVEDARASAFAEDFDASLDRFGRGEAQPEPDSAPPAQGEREGEIGPDFFAPGQCNTRSMSPGSGGAADPCPECGGRCGDPQARLTQADCTWLGNRLDRMDAARPRKARGPVALAAECEGDWESDEIEALQLDAFEAGVTQWWLVVPPPDGDPAAIAKAAAAARDPADPVHWPLIAGAPGGG
jgi:hypothetical protein